ncbi:MAG: hypothetical protein P4L67_04350 [Candidatus Pacebacteria bacterium]|nr:hypothetical protein [Candidatus Paceibacterota bacterium]
MTTDHEAAAEAGRKGVLGRIIRWWNKPSGLEMALDLELKATRAAGADLAQTVVRLKNDARDAEEELDKQARGWKESLDRIAFLEGELKRTIGQLNTKLQADKSLEQLIQERNRFSVEVRERESTIAAKNTEIAGMRSKVKSLDKIRDIVKEQYDLVDEFPDDDEDDDDIADIELEDEPYCDGCGRLEREHPLGLPGGEPVSLGKDHRDPEAGGGMNQAYDS